MDSIDIAPAAVAQCVTAQAAGLRNPASTVGEVLDTLRNGGLGQSVARLRELLGAAGTLGGPTP